MHSSDMIDGTVRSVTLTEDRHKFVLSLREHQKAFTVLASDQQSGGAVFAGGVLRTLSEFLSWMADSGATVKVRMRQSADHDGAAVYAWFWRD